MEVEEDSREVAQKEPYNNGNEYHGHFVLGLAPASVAVADVVGAASGREGTANAVATLIRPDCGFGLDCPGDEE